MNPGWKAAMESELQALNSNHTWDLVKLPANKKFLAYLHEEVYMQYPPGLELPFSSVVCRLRMFLYGLKQASRQWYSRLSSALATHGFVSSLNDYSLFFKVSGQLITIIAVYLDDILLSGNDTSEINRGLVVTQRKFALDLLQEFNCLDCRVVSTPLDPNLKLSATSGSPLPATLILAFCDADWVSCADTRRSVSAEVEYRSICSLVAEITWIVRLLHDLSAPPSLPIPLHCDNQAAIHIAKNPVFHEYTKHIGLDCHFAREKPLDGLISLTFVPSSSQLADLFTKALAGPSHRFLLG
ncbi:uncharacterized protein, partial [Solanum tuberosum]